MSRPTAGADPRVRYQPITISHPNAYDYAPSVLWTGVAGREWIMYWCGYNPATNSDAIFEATSSNGVTWSSPRVAVPVGPPGSMDYGHVCDPTVVKTPVGYAPYAMYYTGKALREDQYKGPNRIFLAYSTDGLTWYKWGSNSPLVDCGNSSSVYGCGMPSVVKVGSTFYMTHLDCHADPCNYEYNNRVRTSTDGINWVAGPTFTQDRARLQAGPDMAYDEATGTWLSVAGGDRKCGTGIETASELVVYRSSTIDGARTEIGCLPYTQMGGAGRWVAEQGFYRHERGNLPSASPDTWLVFGVGNNEFHNASEEIKAAKLALMDAEQNSVDSWWGGAACSSSGPTISAVQFAWTADGPHGDDINYWDVVANNDGRTDYCDRRLQNFTDPNFSTGTRLRIKWYGTTSNGSQPQFDVYFKNAGVYYGPTTFSAPRTRPRRRISPCRAPAVPLRRSCSGSTNGAPTSPSGSTSTASSWSRRHHSGGPAHGRGLGLRELRMGQGSGTRPAARLARASATTKAAASTAAQP